MNDEHPYRAAPGSRGDDVMPVWNEPYAAEALGAAYDELAEEAARGTLRFDRRFRNTVTVVDDGWVSITEMDDDFHSMRVALRIAADGEITRAAGRMLKNPYETCPRALESLR